MQIKILKTRYSLTVSAAQTAVVVGHGNEIVFGLDADALVHHVGGHVERLERKVDERVDLVAVEATVREALEVHDEHGRHAPQVELLC